MIYTLFFSPQAKRTIAKWKKSNPLITKKLFKIFQELAEHPRYGTGHPEALKGGGGVTYSRHVTAKDRIIYDIYDDTVQVLVVDIEGHYDDK